MRRQLPNGSYRWLGAGAATPRGEELEAPRTASASGAPRRSPGTRGRRRPRHVVR